MQKIKWEPILTILISLMSVFVAWKAYEVCELQAEISKNSLLPNIQVKEYSLIDEDTYQVKDSIIEISNSEGRLNNYQSRIVMYLKCEYVDSQFDYFEVDVPVAYYYFVGSSTGNNSGILETKRSMNNAIKLNEFRKELLEYNKTHTEETLVYEEEAGLEITYRDLLGEKQSLYYLINWSYVKI